MPELPEIVTYLDAIDRHVGGDVLEAIRVKSFSLLRTYDPPLESVFGKELIGLRRMGKRIVFAFEDDLFAVLHLMIAGRLHWHAERKAIPGKIGLAAFDFASGTIILTEAGTKRRASLHIVRGEEALAALDPGGLELDGATLEDFRTALLAERHTLKRALTDARQISGIGGAFADEILHRAKLSPMQMNTNLSDDEIARLLEASRETLTKWVQIRREDTGAGFPEKVRSTHPEMAVHGKYNKPCPVCGAPVQRIVYASRETNYCPGCQTGGKILADRSLSRLLKDDWPKTIEDLEA
ncbi:MAG: DNA-formamidopyrimidine glycosylase family protein [Acidimicrobiia bacterium]|nr:DNA-formamidopyrimidine glycosylase family protein [Acidimicrobiia bacterium]